MTTSLSTSDQLPAAECSCSSSCSTSQVLSPRELEVLQLVVKGYTNPKIAETLYISLSTVKTHIRSILSKLGVGDRLQAAIFALRQGLV